MIFFFIIFKIIVGIKYKDKDYKQKDGVMQVV